MLARFCSNGRRTGGTRRAGLFCRARDDIATDAALNLSSRPCLEIAGGRHPVVEQVIDAPFIANDLTMHDDCKLLVITGPNMGGKSTYMRQTALIVILAHVGSFVPADTPAHSDPSTAFSRASVRPTTLPAAARRSWSR